MQQYGHNRCKILYKHEKQRLVEYRKKYYEKNPFNSFQNIFWK